MPLAHLAAGPLAPAQLIPIATLAILYAHRARTLAAEGARRAVPSWRQACFMSGLLLVVIVLISPIGHMSDELLLAHMAEHLLIADIAALLIVLGLTGPLLAPMLRRRVLDRLRALSHPAVAFPLWAIDLYVWHLPALYESAIRHPAVHALEHALLVACGINMWMCLFGPLPMPAWFGNWPKLGYIVGVRLTGAVLGNVFVWSGAAFYSSYAGGEHYWHVSPVGDQSTAGAIMMVEGSILTVSLFCWLFLRAAREGEERQALLELAALHGVELSDARVARAVAAGRGSELRRRLEGRRVPGPGAG